MSKKSKSQNKTVREEVVVQVESKIETVVENINAEKTLKENFPSSDESSGEKVASKKFQNLSNWFDIIDPAKYYLIPEATLVKGRYKHDMLLISFKTRAEADVFFDEHKFDSDYSIISGKEFLTKCQYHFLNAREFFRKLR